MPRVTPTSRQTNSIDPNANTFIRTRRNWQRIQNQLVTATGGPIAVVALPLSLVNGTLSLVLTTNGGLIITSSGTLSTTSGM